MSLGDAALGAAGADDRGLQQIVVDEHPRNLESALSVVQDVRPINARASRPRLRRPIKRDHMRAVAGPFVLGAHDSLREAVRLAVTEDGGEDKRRDWR
jgi:hypothetical protein